MLEHQRILPHNESYCIMSINEVTFDTLLGSSVGSDYFSLSGSNTCASGFIMKLCFQNSHLSDFKKKKRKKNYWKGKLLFASASSMLMNHSLLFAYTCINSDIIYIVHCNLYNHSEFYHSIYAHHWGTFQFTVFDTKDTWTKC